jgi:hypothetical protein
LLHGESDADGLFNLAPLPEGEPLEVTVQHADYTAAQVSGVTPPLEEPLRIELGRGTRVFGHVLGADGSPVEKAAVEAMITRTEMDAPYGDPKEAAVGTDGSYELRGIAAGTVTLTAHAPGFVDARVTDLAVAGGAELGPVEIRLERGATVAGRVTAADGSPAPETLVLVTPSQTPDDPWRGSATRHARADALGEFAVRNVPTGPATVQARNNRLGDASEALEVRPGENQLHLTLSSRGQVRGRVVGADGRPIATAMAQLESSFTLGQGVSPDGSFVFHGIAPGEYRLTASAPGLRPADPPLPVTVGDLPTPEAELVLVPGEEIHGELTGLPAAELESVSVSAWCDDPPTSASATAGTDPWGRYRLDGLAPGHWIVMARKEDTGQRARGEVAVVEGGGPYRLDLDLGGGLTLVGSVDLDGEPLRNGSIGVLGIDVAVSTAAQLRPDGTFRIGGLEPGTYDLLVHFGGSPPHRHRLVLTGDDEVHIALVSASVTGSVSDAAGEPVPAARVMLMSLDGLGGQTPAAMEISDPDGRFAFPRLPPGSYRLTAVAAERGQGQATVALEGGDQREVEIYLEAGGTLTVIPRLGAGARPDRLMMLIVDASGFPVYSQDAAVTADGTATFSAIPDGDHVVTLFGAGTAMVDTRVRVPGPPVDIALPPPAALEIEAPDLAGFQIVPLTVSGPDGRSPMAAQMGPMLGGAALVQGRAHFDLLPPGTWTVRVELGDGQTLEGTAVTTAGETTRLVLQAP